MAGLGLRQHIRDFKFLDMQLRMDTRNSNLPYNVTYKPKNGMMSSLAEARIARAHMADADASCENVLCLLL